MNVGLCVHVNTNQGYSNIWPQYSLTLQISDMTINKEVL